MLTKSEHIRRILHKSFDMPAAEVADRLQDKGIDVVPGLVHTVRSAMKRENDLDAEEKRQIAEEFRQTREATLRTMAAKMQKTKALNPQPLREHILIALGGGNSGLTVQEIVRNCLAGPGGYKLLDNTAKSMEAFKQNVRKKVRLLVVSGEADQKGDKFLPKQWSLIANRKADGEVGQLVPQPVQRQVVQGQHQEVVNTENGIAFLVAKLKAIVAKVGKKETKDLIDVL